MVEQAGDDNPSRVARNILHALRNAGFTVSRTAAPTAPSTAAGEHTALSQAIYERLFDLRDSGEEISELHPHVQREVDAIMRVIASAPPAQGGNPFRAAMHDAYVASEGGVTWHEDDPKRTLGEIVAWTMNFIDAATPEAAEREYLARQYLAIARDHAGHIVVEQHGPNGEEPCTVADLIDAALATPPAQMKYGEKTYGEGRDEAANFIFTGLSEALGLDGFTIQDGSETWDGDVRATLMGILRDANVIDEETNERITPPAPSVPWQEQAARRCEELAGKLVERASAAPSTFKRIQTNADAVKLRDRARAFRALLSKPAKGDTTNDR